MPPIPPGVWDSLPPVASGLILAIFMLMFLLKEWRQGLSERAKDAESKLKEVQQESEEQLTKLQQQIKDMQDNFDRQFAELRRQLNEKIERLQEDNLVLNESNYHLRRRLSENGISHTDII